METLDMDDNNEDKTTQSTEKKDKPKVNKFWTEFFSPEIDWFNFIFYLFVRIVMPLSKSLKDVVGNPLSPKPKDQVITDKFWTPLVKKGCGCKHGWSMLLCMSFYGWGRKS